MTPNLCPACGYDQFAYLQNRWHCMGCWKPQDEPAAKAIDIEKLLEGREGDADLASDA